MTGKERAEFRKQANTLTAIFQIGKENITAPLIEAVDAALKKRELIKLSVLETSELSAKEAAEQLAGATGAEIIQCIGRKLVLYRKKEEDA
ncbi:MAG: YhbY family RNA-binding protein [Clostridia bacterium]|jgi:RNA-binding protein|nr:YhbY family RNA-binding protein [Clostridia bacterium]MBR0437186.1 YhbY family RNA-binding protein [Clostridia bacterium]MBR3038846.1 YhbY family RNA-binding protein [Clostridia bacterium]